jgi:hypothetical protein
VTTTTCTVTYTYAGAAARAMARDGRAEATAVVHGRTIVVGSGRIRDRRLRLTFRHLKRGRYWLTLLQLRAHHRPVVIGHTSLEISLARGAQRAAGHTPAARPTL